MRSDPLFQIRACAHEIILRDSGFWALLVIVTAIALMDWPGLALTVGGVLNLVWCAALALCAARARHRDYRRTEVWQVLKKQVDMPARTAQIVFSQTLRAAYLRFARLSGLAALIFFTMASLWYAHQTLVASAAGDPEGAAANLAAGHAWTFPHSRH